MPNWCSNIVTSTEEVINALRDKEGGIDFNNIVPMPPHQPDLDKPNAFYAEGGLSQEQEHAYGRANTWYHWSVAHWGTKWNSRELYMDNPTAVSFDTAWSPPIPVIKALSEKFPTAEVNIRYTEEGMSFKGSETYLNGEKIAEVNLGWQLQSSCPCCKESCYDVEEDDDQSITYACNECGCTFKLEDAGKTVKRTILKEGKSNENV